MRKFMVFAALIIVSSCVDRGPLAPVGSPSASISDAVHGFGTAGFYFLPPLVTNPAAMGAIDETLLPHLAVQVCEWSGSACASPLVANFTAERGPSSETVRIGSDGASYIVNWHTGDANLDPTKSYRIRVLVAGTEMGHVDVDVVSGGQALKKVDPDQFVGLVDGRTLPIKFRIEDGAVTVIGQAGGVVTGGDGQVRLEFSPSSVSQDVGVIVRRLEDAVDADLVPRTMFEIQPDGLLFASVVRLEIGYDPRALQSGTDEGLIRLEHHVNNRWTPVDGSVVDLSAHIVTAPIPGFSRWRIARFRAAPPPSGPWRQVTVGEEHTCGLTTDGRIFCWGRGINGQLGVGDFEDRLGPSRVVSSRRFLEIDAGAEHTCALQIDIELPSANAPGWPAFCWGQNIWGQLGVGFSTLTGNFGLSAPVQVLGGDRFTSISAGGVSTCGVNAVGDFTRCWGSGATLPGEFAPGIPFFRVTVGGTTQPGVRHGCGLAFTGDLYCWGHIFASWSSPRVEQGGFLGTGLGRLTSGGLHACGIPTGDVPSPDQANGPIYCLGENDHGQLGDGTTETSTTPVEVRGGSARYWWVSAGLYHTCALTADSSAYCWGDNTSGQLGASVGARSLTPVRVSGDLRFAQIASGDEHTCGLTTEGAIYCWGSNSSGQLGNGTRVSSSTPVLVPAPQ